MYVGTVVIYRVIINNVIWNNFKILKQLLLIANGLLMTRGIWIENLQYMASFPQPGLTKFLETRYHQDSCVGSSDNDKTSNSEANCGF